MFLEYFKQFKPFLFSLFTVISYEYRAIFLKKGSDIRMASMTRHHEREKQKRELVLPNRKATC